MKNAFLRNHRSFLILLFIWIVVFSGLRTIQHLSFGTNTYDLSIFDYMMHFTLKGEFMAEPFHGYWGTHFAIHFMPILFLLVPFYLIFQGPLFLLYIQVIVCALSAFMLYLIAKKEFPEKHTAFLIGLAYLLYRPFLNGVMYDFHPEMFFPLFLFSAYYFAAVRKNSVFYFLSIVLALSIKEDTAILLFFFGLFLVFKLKDDRKTGLITSAVSLLYGLVTLGAVIPFFRDQVGLQGRFEFVNLWGYEGDTVFDILKAFIAHPFQILASIPWIKSLSKFVNLAGPLLFIPFLSSAALLILPPVLILITSRSPVMSGFGLHYAANIFPFLFLAFVFGLKNLQENFLKKKENKTKILLFIVVIVVLINLANTKWNLLKPSRYASLKDIKTVRLCIERIPESASVASLSSLIPHIPKRRNISMLPQTEEAQYILIHSGINIWPYTAEEFQQFFNDLKDSEQYDKIIEEGDVFLFRRKGPE